ncbi:Endothelial differentiation-related factor 1 [Trichinella zimbabwensis]|uniref:Endothelial differentiation-related factor 1 n=2 Tax=Trichinella TaxID=6333 RepID=A0A0V1M751_9BILA|nr:Endothelial differentiation-related factor 1 [Trichinella zimbabwensis]KRZ67629.1 Endothelial differentiation-related factor 1 [Trichinella papuae]
MNLQSNTGWDTVTILRKNQPRKSEARQEKVVRAAQQSGKEIETSKKFNAATNKQHQMSASVNKLSGDLEEFHHNTVGMEVGRLIQRGRQEKKWTQAELAKQINEKPSVIVEYESGRAVVNNQILGKIERAIGIKLRGKDKGQPFQTKVPKGKQAEKK